MKKKLQVEASHIQAALTHMTVLGMTKLRRF